MLEVHCSSKLSPDLKIVPDWVESVIASLPVTESRQQEINNQTNIQISIVDCLTELFTSHSDCFFLYRVNCWCSYLSSQDCYQLSREGR